jgi:rRNA processing protein Gar1
MTTDEIWKILQIFGPALAAYISVKVGMAVALERANNALKSAEAAHKRIDKLHELMP